MADNQPKTPEDIEKELSAGKFAKQQVRTFGFLIGGTALGAGAGWGLGKLGLGRKLGQWLGRKQIKEMTEVGGEVMKKAAEEFAAKEGGKIMMWGGGLVGMLGGTAASQYEHWAKVERERLSVQEINRDVAGLMEKRAQFEETLDKQRNVVDEMLKRQQTGFAEKIEAKRDEAATIEPGRK